MRVVTRILYRGRNRSALRKLQAALQSIITRDQQISDDGGEPFYSSDEFAKVAAVKVATDNALARTITLTLPR